MPPPYRYHASHAASRTGWPARRKAVPGRRGARAMAPTAAETAGVRTTRVGVEPSGVAATLVGAVLTAATVAAVVCYPPRQG